MYNNLSDIEQMLGYLEQAAGFYYLQTPGSWQSAFQTLSETAKMVGLVGGEASAEITNIASAYTSVGKDIYATAESGLKNAPVVEGVFTQADQQTAVVGQSALGTYIAGIAAGFTLPTAIAGIAAGMGIGILGYETAPEGWVEISNAIFGTNLTPTDVQPLISSYVSGMFAKDANGHIQTYLDKAVLDRAYNYFKEHLVGGIDFDFMENVTWVAPSGSTIPTHPTDYTQLVNKQIPIGGKVTDDLLSYVYELVTQCAAILEIEMPEFSMNGIINDIRTLYPNFNNADFFNINFYYWWLEGSVANFKLTIDGYRFNAYYITVDIHGDRRLILGDPGEPYLDDDFAYWMMNDDFTNAYSQYGSDKLLFSYQKDFNTGTSVIQDNGKSLGANQGIWLNSLTDMYKDGNRHDIVVDISTAGSNAGPLPQTDETLKNKGVTVSRKVALGGRGYGTVTTHYLPRKTNFQDQYATWYGNKKEVGQPDENGEPKIITYIPTPIPMTYPDPSQLADNGIGNAENPNSQPAQIPEANPQGLPQAVPENAPSNNVSDPQENAKKQYNDSRKVPGSVPDDIPEYEPNPKFPDNPPKEPDPGTDSGTTPAPGDIPGVEESDLVSVYNPTKAQIQSFASWLWSPNFIDNLLKLFQNPMDAIIGLHVIYATPTAGKTGNIRCGYLDSGVSSKIVTKQYTEIDCGTVNVPEYFGNALDYEPYVQIHAYLPFVGIVSLKPNDILGKRLNIKYGIDVLTGTCLAMLTTYKGTGQDAAKILTYTYAGNCATQVPISGGSYAQVITGLASMAIGVGTGVASGNPLAIAGGVMAGIMSSHFDVSHSGSIGANAGAMGPRKPYLIITRKSAYEANNYNAFYGYPANMTVVLGSCRGYTRVKTVHIDSIYTATDAEKIEIESLLKQGVIIK